jgi:hypothetical protein
VGGTIAGTNPSGARGRCPHPPRELKTRERGERKEERRRNGKKKRRDMKEGGLGGMCECGRSSYS